MRCRFRGFKLPQLKAYVQDPKNNHQNAKTFASMKAEEMQVTSSKDASDGGRASVRGPLVHHTVKSEQNMRETYEMDRELLWRNREDFVTLFQSTPEDLGATHESQVIPSGNTLSGWRTEMADFKLCREFKGKKPRSVVLVNVDFVAQVGIEGNFGTDADQADIRSSTTAIGQNKLHIGQASSADDMMRKKQRVDQKLEEQAERERVARDQGVGDEEVDPNLQEDALLDPLAGVPAEVPSSSRRGTDTPRKAAVAKKGAPAKKGVAGKSEASTSAPNTRARSRSPLGSDQTLRSRIDIALRV